ncbi:glycoside hydrolase family 3 N-terminal domain-containing protein [Acidothermaceae bacterium B102]|nr:glycoside hydrolase family 3 N-terminal domain-containing protein [Acidothermaceae bacterium B102]
MSDTGVTQEAPWQDPSQPVDLRVADLLARMDRTEKVAQLSGLWVGLDSSGEGVAPHQHDFGREPLDWKATIAHGLGQLTRPFGTKPVDPSAGVQGLVATQREVVAANRFGIPALVHEECLTGLAAWTATVYPAPLSWGASFDAELVERMAARIGTTMRSLGIHQGLAPVLDVARDLRWGRVEETIGEDPFLVATIGSAYVRGLESAGIVSTLKHFVGYSSSRAGRNLAPVSIGPRELADVLLPPFEMALRAGARSVMNAYTDMDGVPSAADVPLLTGLLRDVYGFDGTVVADYFAVAFLQSLHGVASSPGHAAGLALDAGVDVELPTVHCYGQPLLDGLASGEIQDDVVERAAARVLRQKFELGLLDPNWEPVPAGEAVLDLDDPESRAVALALAERSVILLANDGVLPLLPGRRVAVVGPRADESSGFLGCYSFPIHVGSQHPETPMGLDVPTLLEALRGEMATSELTFAQGCPVLGGDDENIAAAAELAAVADVCVAVLGDLAGLFGRGTSGEGCDVQDLHLPGRQEELLEALLATGTPVVLVLLVGRPYDISAQIDRLASVVVGFFSGEEGAAAVAGVLTGRLNPSGRLPVSFPGSGSSQPATYLAANLGRRSAVSNIDPTPVFPFGHGLAYSSATWRDVALTTDAEWPTDGRCGIRVVLTNEQSRVTSEVVQVYLHDEVSEVVRPSAMLVAYARVDLEPGETKQVDLLIHADQVSYTGLAGVRIVEPGAVRLLVGRSSSDLVATLQVELVGDRREVGFERVMTPLVTIS